MMFSLTGLTSVLLWTETERWLDRTVIAYARTVLVCKALHGNNYYVLYVLVLQCVHKNIFFYFL